METKFSHVIFVWLIVLNVIRQTLRKKVGFRKIDRDKVQNLVSYR